MRIGPADVLAPFWSGIQQRREEAPDLMFLMFHFFESQLEIKRRRLYRMSGELSRLRVVAKKVRIRGESGDAFVYGREGVAGTGGGRERGGRGLDIE
jgi:hypothetical protein